MTKLLLTALLAVFLLPATALATQPSHLHESEARLGQQHKGYQKADQIRAFQIAFGSCVRRDTGTFDCGVSLWRRRYGIQEKCRLLVRVTAIRQHGRRSVHATQREFWCGLADPTVPEPTPAPKPAPKPKPQPTYPNTGSPYWPS